VRHVGMTTTAATVAVTPGRHVARCVGASGTRCNTASAWGQCEAVCECSNTRRGGGGV